MITFLPYRDYIQVAKCLDSKRLNKQIIEVVDILKEKNPHHPAVLMWKKFHNNLKKYGYYLCQEYQQRFNKEHSFAGKFKNNFSNPPDWLDEKIIISHRINLLRKDYDYYSKFFKLKSDKNLDQYPKGYYWPTCYGTYCQECSDNWKKYIEDHKVEF